MAPTYNAVFQMVIPASTLVSGEQPETNVSSNVSTTTNTTSPDPPP